MTLVNMIYRPSERLAYYSNRKAQRKQGEKREDAVSYYKRNDKRKEGGETK